MRRVILSPVACLAVPFFPNYLISSMIFGKNVTYKMCALIFYTNFVRNISNYKQNWPRYYHKYPYVIILKSPLFLSNFNRIWIFSTVCRKILNCQILLHPSNGSRIVPCGRKDRRTNIATLIVAFVILLKTQKNGHTFLKYSSQLNKHLMLRIRYPWPLNSFYPLGYVAVRKLN